LYKRNKHSYGSHFTYCWKWFKKDCASLF